MLILEKELQRAPWKGLERRARIGAWAWGKEIQHILGVGKNAEDRLCRGAVHLKLINESGGQCPGGEWALGQ